MSPVQIVLMVVAAVAMLAVVSLLVLPKTKTIRVVRTIPATAPAIFAIVSDIGRMPSWYPNAVSAEKKAGRDGPARRQLVSVNEGGSTHEHEQQVTTWINDRQYGWKETPAVGPLTEHRTVFTLTDRGAQTEVELLGEWTARTLLAKIHANFARAAQERARFEAILANVEKVVRA